jgi:hypothetical protein
MVPEDFTPMVNPSGNMQLNGITDRELAEIFEIKAKHSPTVFNFNPQPIQNTGSSPAIYNNVTFNWNGIEGLQIAQRLIAFLINPEEKAKAQGQ